MTDRGLQGAGVSARPAWRGIRSVTLLAVALGVTAGVGQTGAQGREAEAAPETYRVLLNRYCVGCHNDRLRTAGLTLERLDVADVVAEAPVWEKVIRKLRIGSMPPSPRSRPDRAATRAFVAYLETTIDAAATAQPHPGRPAPHRLNRTEYGNAVRDLLGVEIDVRSVLPADDSGYGFDNNADVLSLSPGLLNRYLIAANKIGRLAVGDPTIPPLTDVYRVSRYLSQDGRMGEEMPFGSRGGTAVQHYFPVDGEYVISVRLSESGFGSVRGLRRSNTLDLRLDGHLLGSFAIGGGAATGVPPGGSSQTGDDGPQVRVAVTAGLRRISAAFVSEPRLDEGIFQPRPPIGTFDELNRFDADAGVDRIEVRGPYDGTTPADTVSRRRVFVCIPEAPSEELSCATRIARTLARRAYRRPVSDAEVEKLLAIYQEGHAAGGFDTGIEWVIERVLVSPAFLYRTPTEPVDATPGAPYPLSGIELASRLSFFLWSSIPDDELLAAAERGRLGEPEVLEQQVRRMLRDPRASSLISNFAGQWLWQRNLLVHTPDRELYAEFDDNLRQAFQTETRLFLESQLRADRPVLELLTADYTFVNDRLARHYEIPDIYGSHFRRVELVDDRRGGLLGHGSILTVTSYANRTSPVVRGKWLLENVLGAPPPPPPPNVPALEENEDRALPTSVRERLEAHRRNPVCANCHAPMDPLGFALENFDATGRWRNLGEGGAPIDASGQLLDGTPFDGPKAFREALAARGEEFVGTLLEKLLTYSLGRGLEFYDMPAVRGVMRQAAADDYRWSALLVGIVKSVPFQMRSAEPTAPQAASVSLPQERAP